MAILYSKKVLMDKNGTHFDTFFPFTIQIKTLYLQPKTNKFNILSFYHLPLDH